MDRVKKVGAKEKKQEAARLQLPESLSRLLHALQAASCRDLQQSYGSTSMDGLSEVVITPMASDGSEGYVPTWDIVYRLYYPGAKPDAWRRRTSTEELDRLCIPLIRLECSSRLPDGVHISGTCVPKPHTVDTTEAAIDEVIKVLNRIGIQLIETPIKPTANT